MAVVYLIRHADVENPHRVLYGHLPGFGLSQLGRRQAAAVGQGLRSDPPRRIVHSPLQRATETAEIIAANLATPVELSVDERLREAEFSRYLQGVPYWQVPLRRPLWFIHKLHRGLLRRDESIARMGGRVLDVMFDLAHNHPDEVSACVSHADPLQAAWILLDGRPRNEREMHRRQVAKAGCLRITLQNEAVVDVAYLPPPKPTGGAVEPAAGAA